MTISTKKIIGVLFFIYCTSTIQAQSGNSGYNVLGGGGNCGCSQSVGNLTNPLQRTIREKQKEMGPTTPEEIIESEIKILVEELELNTFEEAVVSTILINSIKKRTELSILKLTPEKNTEIIKKIYQTQQEELKSGLPEEKYVALLKLQQEGYKKSQKKKKRKNKNS